MPEGSATAKAILYNLRRWSALTRYLDDGELPIDDNWVENRIHPIALGRNNWLFAGFAGAGRRAAVVMSLVQSARLTGDDPYAYLATCSSGCRSRLSIASRTYCRTSGGPPALGASTDPAPRGRGCSPAVYR